MKAKSILVAAVGFSLAVARVAVNATEKPTTPPLGDASVFQDATNIVFRLSLGLETNKLGQEIPKRKEFVVRDPKLVRKLVSSIQLASGVELKDMHVYGVTFQRPSGEISAHFCSSCFTIVDSHNPYRYRHYAMPKEFYTEFRRLARQNGWRVERK